MMKKKYDLGEFQREIEIEGYHKFTNEGMKGLFDHFTKREKDEGKELIFDAEAIAEGYHEYSSLTEYNRINSTNYQELEQLPEDYIYISYYSFIIVESKLQ